MLSFEEILFPLLYDFGGSLGPGHESTVVERDSGFDFALATWANARRRYSSIVLSVKTAVDLMTVKTFCYCRTGSAAGFRLHDTTDFTSAVDGKSAPTMLDEPVRLDVFGNRRLSKTYGGSIIRWIFKPVVGTVKLADGGVLVSPGAYAVDTTTGIITGYTPTGLLTAGFQFDVPVRFDGPLTLQIDDAFIGSVQSVAMRELIYPA